MIKDLAPGRAQKLKAKDLEQLFEGTYFSALLEILDPDYDPARFENALAASKDGGGTSRRMHIIHLGLKEFAAKHCSSIEPMIEKIDFQALDREPTRQGVSEVKSPTQAPPPSPGFPSAGPFPRVFPLSGPNPQGHRHLTNLYWQVLLLFVLASCFCDTNEAYIQIIQKMDPKLQSTVFRVVQEIQDEENGTVAKDQTATTDSARVDTDLAHEAAISDLQRDAEEAKRQAASLRLRLDRLQDSYDQLVKEHGDLQDQNGDLKKQIDSGASDFDRYRLERHLKENETLIANLENERNSLMEERDGLLKEQARLEAAAKNADLLLDENRELKNENEKLSKKANMADNLRKKVEASKHIKDELTALRNDKIDLNKTYSDLARANAKIETLKRESEAYASKMQGYEIEIADMRAQKLALVSQNQDVVIRLSEMERRSQLDEDIVKELQEKVLMLDPSAVMDDSLAARPTSLEDELSESNNNMVSMRSLEVQRLQAENAVLKSTIGLETDKGQLVQEMEDLRDSRKAIQDRYDDVLEKFTVGQKQLDTIIEKMNGQGLVALLQSCYNEDPDTKWLMSHYIREEAYSNLRTQVLAEQSRSKHFETQIEQLKQQLGDKDRALLEARGDCKAIFLEYVLSGQVADTAEKVSAVEKSSVDTLTELKNTDGMLATSLRAELEVERKRYRLLKEELENTRGKLLAVFIEKDELRRELEHASFELSKAADGQAVNMDYIKQSEKMEKLRARYKQLQQVSETLSDAPDTTSDEEDPDVVSLDERRQSWWESVSPLFGNSPPSVDNGFHPYEVSDSGSITVPECSALMKSVAGGSAAPTAGYISADHTSVAPARPATTPPDLKSSKTEKRKSLMDLWRHRSRRPSFSSDSGI